MDKEGETSWMESPKMQQPPRGVMQKSCQKLPLKAVCSLFPTIRCVLATSVKINRAVLEIFRNEMMCN